MARMEGVPFLGIAGNGVMTAQDVVVVHTIVGPQSGGNAAHWTTGGSGQIIQARDTRYRSAANLNGNYRCLAIENEDKGIAFPAWSGSNVPRFTAPQAESIARILVWCHRTHGIPLELAPDSKPGRRGIAYHRQGIDGNFGGFAYGGRVPGGELWSSAFGKVCPGDRRIAQLINEIIPRARVLAGLQQGTQQEDTLDPVNNAHDEALLGRVAAFVGDSPVNAFGRLAGIDKLPMVVKIDQAALDIADTKRMTAEILAAQNDDADFSADAVMAQLTAAAEKGSFEGARQAVTNTVLPALTRIEQAVANGDHEEAAAIIRALADALKAGAPASS